MTEDKTIKKRAKHVYCLL